MEESLAGPSWSGDPELSILFAVRLAFIANNARMMPTYKPTRKSVHLGIRQSKFPDLMHDFALKLLPFSPSLKDVKLFLDAAEKTNEKWEETE